ncbi:MAG: Coenzyme F420 hydrogenase/dehydrogenase, beta subunit C-terminal domain [Halobacteriota archaeon]|nr:Coenzyme F420 hydrogenase/dehydrogenase, beta subunit C-terminal domain [Halobacteriota archaeon]
MIEVGKSYIAWAKDEATRDKGASGGFVTALMAAALDKNFIEEALVVKKKGVYEGVPEIINDAGEVLESAGSLHSAPVNLAKYVKKGIKMAMPAKPCDARGVIEQAKRNQVNLEDVYIVGLNCGGSMRPVPTIRMVEEFYELDPSSVVGEEITRGQLIFETKDGEKAHKIDEVEERGYGRRISCRYCATNIPEMADLACGNWGVPKDKSGQGTFVQVLTDKGKDIFQNAVDAGYVEFEEASDKSLEIREKIDGTMRNLADEWHKKVFSEVDELSSADRLSYYIDAFKDCIDCGGCRKICPVCACGDDSKCLQMEYEDDSYKLSMFHMVRLLHLMDSCIGCGQCEDVCPVDIPLTMIHRRFADRMQSRLGHIPGMNMDRPPLYEVELRS